MNAVVGPVAEACHSEASGFVSVYSARAQFLGPRIYMEADLFIRVGDETFTRRWQAEEVADATRQSVGQFAHLITRARVRR
jgi:hypothetical protein